MGIQGLLPLLKSIHEHRKLSDFSGKTLAVDGYVWLHRGVYSCAAQLVNGEPTTRYVDFAMSRIRLLLHHNITPYVVFDGGPLPAKRITESRRRQSRQEHREVATCLLQQGKNNEAYEHLAKAVDVSPELAYQFIKALRAHRVPYIVAPYEADAQLAFLEINSTVDGIITEDSDLLVFGCKLVLFKLDSDGNCMCIRRNRFSTVREISLHGWTDQQFRHMAILAGCDYLPSIPGLGLKTSHRLLRKYKTVERVLQAIRAQSRLKIPPNYLEDFRTAELAFIRQRVYDPDSGRLVCLTLDSIPIEQGCERFIGEDMEPSLARLVAQGDINPLTLCEIVDIQPQFQPGDFSLSKPASGTQIAKIKEICSESLPITHYFKPTSSSNASTGLVPNADSILAAKENIVVRRPKPRNSSTSSTPPISQARKRKLDTQEDNLDGFITTPIFSRYFRRGQRLNTSPASEGELVVSPDAPHTLISGDNSARVKLSLRKYSFSSDFDEIPSPARQPRSPEGSKSRSFSDEKHPLLALHVSPMDQPSRKLHQDSLPFPDMTGAVDGVQCHAGRGARTTFVDSQRQYLDADCINAAHCALEDPFVFSDSRDKREASLQSVMHSAEFPHSAVLSRHTMGLTHLDDTFIACPPSGIITGHDKYFSHPLSYERNLRAEHKPLRLR